MENLKSVFDVLGKEFSEPLLMIPVVALLVVGIWQFVSARGSMKKLRDILKTQKNLEEQLEKDWLAKEPSSKTFLIKKPLRAEINDWLAHRWDESTASRIGTAYTGGALFMSFSLVAWIMVADVSEALKSQPNDDNAANSQSSGGGAPEKPSDVELQKRKAEAAVAIAAKTNSKLGDAVKGMGAKFFVSALGVLLAVLDGLFFRRYTKGVIDRAGKDDKNSIESAISAIKCTLIGSGGAGAGRDVPIEKLEALMKETQGTLEELAKHVFKIPVPPTPPTGGLREPPIGPDIKTPRWDPAILLQRIERHRAR
jgi:hypothetical protein